MFIIPDSIIDLYTIGDMHGEWNAILYQIKQYKISNSAFIFCGDFGLGFEKENYYKEQVIPKIHKILKKFNCIWYIIRGNHDDPSYFSEQKINTKYIKCVPDYSLIQFKNKNILCIGGGISIDRIWRQHQDQKRFEQYAHYHNITIEEAQKICPASYWENERIMYQPKIKEHVDIICSHSAPSFCYPVNKGPIVYHYAELDPDLLEDLDNERKLLDKVYDDYQNTLSNWYYGHFHSSNMQFINNCMFKLLSINEICRHVTDDYNLL